MSQYRPCRTANESSPASRRVTSKREGGQRRGVAGRPRPAPGPHLGLEELPDHSPGVTVLELGRACRQHLHPGAGGLLAGLGQQPGLAHPRHALHQQRRSATRTGGIDRRRYRRQFRRTVKQWARPRRPPRPHAGDGSQRTGHVITEPGGSTGGAHRDAPVSNETDHTKANGRVRFEHR